MEVGGGLPPTRSFETVYPWEGGAALRINAGAQGTVAFLLEFSAGLDQSRSWR